MTIPDKLKLFFTDLDTLAQAQAMLFDGGEIGIFEADQKMFVLPENQGDLQIDTLWAFCEGSGWGKAVMGLITDLADRHGLSIYLRALARSDVEQQDSIDQGSLEAFYSGFGFVDVGSWDCRDMVRRPRPASPESEQRLADAYAGAVLWRIPAGLSP